MNDPFLWNICVYWFLGVCGGVASAIGDPSTPSLPLRRSCGKSFAGGASGIFMGFWCLHAYPTDLSYQVMASIGGGFLGPFWIWTLIRLKYGSNIGAGDKSPRPPSSGDKT